MPQGELEIRRGRVRALGVVARLLAAGEQHIGADRRPYRKKQRQQAERIGAVVPARLDKSIEQPARRVVQPEMDEVHEREGEIVEDVGGRNCRIELDGVEQYGLAVEQHDVAEMGVTMAAAHQAFCRTLFQQRHRLGEALMAEAIETLDRLARQRGLGTEFRGVAVDDLRDGWQPCRSIRSLGVQVRITDHIRQRLAKRGRDLAGARQVIEGPALIETGHLDRPFDHFALAVDLRAVRPARDRNDAAVKHRRMATVDRQFLLAGLLAQRERRVVQEGQPHRALDLQHALGFQEHDRDMGIDPRRSAAADALVEEGECRALIGRVGDRRRHGHAARPAPRAANIVACML